MSPEWEEFEGGYLFMAWSQLGSRKSCYFGLTLTFRLLLLLSMMFTACHLRGKWKRLIKQLIRRLMKPLMLKYICCAPTRIYSNDENRCYPPKGIYCIEKVVFYFVWLWRLLFQCNIFFFKGIYCIEKVVFTTKQNKWSADATVCFLATWLINFK